MSERHPGAAPGESSPRVKLELRHVTKSYGDVVAARDVSLEVLDGEFLTLLGPSGSGKTTLLTIIAGLASPTSGHILVDGVDATSTPPYRRDMGVVFQNYALFPHMSVFENIAFPLRMRGLSSRQIADRVADALALVRLPNVSARYPRQLSGGQQQRIALARALVFEPSILLMDEPLGALDRKLREEMQHEIRRIQQSLRITACYVTHDQVEALVMSDRVAIISEAQLVQLAAPTEVYERPATEFVASFLGESNILTGEISVDRSGRRSVRVDANDSVGEALRIDLPETQLLHDTGRVSVAIRPERILLSRAEGDQDRPDGVYGSVDDIGYLGDSYRYVVRLPNGRTLVVRRGSRDADRAPQVGTSVWLTWSAADVVVLADRG